MDCANSYDWHSQILETTLFCIITNTKVIRWSPLVISKRLLYIKEDKQT